MSPAISASAGLAASRLAPRKPSGTSLLMSWSRTPTCTVPVLSSYVRSQKDRFAVAVADASAPVTPVQSSLCGFSAYTAGL